MDISSYTIVPFYFLVPDIKMQIMDQFHFLLFTQRQSLSQICKYKFTLSIIYQDKDSIMESTPRRLAD